MEEEIVRDYNRDSRGGNRGGRRFDSRGGGRREMHDTVCSNCGKDCKVPFRPTGDKPVYCSECFDARGGRDNRRSFSKGDRYNQKPGQDNQRQFDDLHKKMDIIIDTLMYVKKTLKEEPAKTVEKELVKLIEEKPAKLIKEDKPKKKTKTKAKAKTKAKK